MYYNDYDRVKKVERLLQKLAYLSVLFDFIIALASLLVLRGAAFSRLMLTISGDLILAEMVVIGVIFMILMALKHYNSIMDNFAEAAFKNVRMRKATKTFKKVVIDPVVLLGRMLLGSA